MKPGLLFTSMLLATACTDRSLGPIVESSQSVVDDRLELEVEVCTSTPESQVFPVKIMFIVDSSGSLQFTDPSNATADACETACNNTAGTTAAQCSSICAGAENPGRYNAVKAVIDRYANNPAVSFSVVRFASTVSVNGDPAGLDTTFTRDQAVLDGALNSLLEADLFTDYQSGLSTALSVLERDMTRTDPVELTRSKYVIIFLSDGNPDPVCTEGCDNDPDIRDAVSLESWCDLPRNEWCSRREVRPDGSKGVPYIVTDPDLCSEITNAWYPSMQEPCAGFNSDDDVLLKVRQMMELADEYGVADIQLHTAFLWVELPQLIADVFKLDEDEAISLMTEMARAGNNGQFRAFNSGQEIDFLDINYSSVARPFGMTSFIVTNPHAIPNLDHLAIDTDGDGLSDDTEFQESLQSSSGDSDGDGYSDLLELRQLNAGFDPRDASKPVRFCPSPERGDRDGDGLRDCDEKIVGTDLKIADSDRDRIPDGIEYWFGSDPTTHDTKKDVDVDQRFTEQEIKTHSSPTVSDPIIHSEYLYSYTVLGAKDQIDRSKCHRFNVSQVRLVTTKPTAGLGSIGYNEIIALFGEGLVDDPRDFGHFKAACIRARYVEQACEIDGEERTCGLKDPANGRIVLQPSDFLDLAELAARRKAARNDPSVDPCVGVPAP
jgi:hypothetical protein